MKTAYTNGTIFTMDAANEWYKNGIIITEDGRIVYAGPPNDFEQQSVDETIDLKGKWVLPGLVNTHSHILMTILRGTGDDMNLKPWLEQRVWPLEQQFTPEIGTASARLGVLEMLKSGTTTFSDMFNPNGIDSDEVIHAIADSGIRGAFSHTVFSAGSEADQRANLNEAERFAKTYRSFADGRFTTMIAPHSPYTCTPKALEECARLAKENKVMAHIHVAETDGEIEEILTRYGARPIEHIRRSGLFDVPAIMAHGVVLNDEERAFMKERDIRVAHNPVSNLKLGSGVADVAALREADVKVGIATDGVMSNNNFDMFEELRLAALLQKGTYKDATRLPAEEILAMATRIGAEAVGMKHTGCLKSGRCADFITIDPSDKPHLQPAAEACSHLVYAVSGKDVCDVYVEGRQLVKDGQCLTMDEEKIIADANRLRKQLEI
ncbi:5-methylthioadenosine deaminase [Alteribacter lacisalsi]|uniref:5-methylthioadenosine/S-adenosylhomocysteine deaminase n=1 Tax=Alteribacter lacisalsi TaxID=2045244 RepID=A0A2W0HHL9_9BACI|nr:5-methylthioadenosine deaminase [Alteribacter lacisalsi]